MPAVTRLGNRCTGHGCWPPRPSTSAAASVFVNGIAVHRVGDSWATHCCKRSCHSSVLAGGSSTVFAEGKGVGRIGDPVACGSRVAQGSPNVFAGG
ncbi:PAAR domain-containing protein [Thauera propionica]|uniref:PAAR domain-containing protein n=1 Tax=Thauera propionica TaxID=2019431 RepID=UPI003C702284